MLTSETFAHVASALAAAQGKFSTIVRDKTVKVLTKARGDRPAGSYTYKYAPLESILSAVRPALSECGLALVQAPMLSDGAEVLHTRLIHSSGEWIGCNVPIFFITGDNMSQAHASGVTYARRYGVSNLLCVAADEDDDGAGGSAQNEEGTNTVVRYQGPDIPSKRNNGMPAADELEQALRDFSDTRAAPAPAAAAEGKDDGAIDLRNQPGPAVDETTGEILSPWGPDLTQGQIAMAKQRAKNAGLSESGVVGLVGVITAATITEALKTIQGHNG